jgi:hypothetical protein
MNLADCVFAQVDSMDIAFPLELEPVQRLSTHRLHEATDKSFPHCRVVDANESGHDVYVVIALLAA